MYRLSALHQQNAKMEGTYTIIWDIFNKGLSLEHNNIHIRVFVQNNLFKIYKRSSALYAIFDLQFVLGEQACLINYQNLSVKISGGKKLRKIKNRQHDD